MMTAEAIFSRFVTERPMKKIWINYTASYVPPLMSSYGVESGIYRADGAKEIFERLMSLPDFIKTEQPEKKVEKTEAPEEKKEAVSKENTAIKTEDAPKKEATEKKVEKTEAPVKKAEPEKKVEFEKKPPVVNRETPAPKKDEFVRKPQGATQNAAGNQTKPTFQQGQGANRPPRQDNFTQRPGNQSSQNRQGFQNGANNDRNRTNDRFGNPFAQGGQKPQTRDGVRKPEKSQGSFNKDKDSEGGTHGGRVDSFKPTVITREQTKKGETITKKGATRVVDMRAESVDLSKYDEKERLDKYANDLVGDLRGGNQRVKRQAPQNARQGFNKKAQKSASSQPVTKAPTSVTIPDEIMVSELASRLKVTAAEVVKRLMLLGMMVTVNQTVDFDTAAIVAEEMGISVSNVSTKTARLRNKIERLGFFCFTFVGQFIIKNFF